MTLTPDEIMEDAKQEAIREAMEEGQLQLATYITKDYYSDDELLSIIDFDGMWDKI